MDFLDPTTKRSRSIRLAIGHSLMAIVILIGTYILVSQAYGFDLDKKNGAVIQNGLVFVDSAPGGAQIFLNGQEQKDKTNGRFAIPEGSYKLEIKKEGYRTWSRNFEILGGHVERFAYPLLVPQDLKSDNLKSFSTLPGLGLESPDRRWILVANPGSLGSFTQYDLNDLKGKKPTSTNVSFPANVFNAAPGAHTIELVEWSTDNKHVLVKHTFTGGNEFVVLNREVPGESINVNKLLNVNPAMVVLRDKKFDQLYLYFNEGGQLKTASLKDKTITPVLAGVLNFKPHGSDVILYAQHIPGDSSKIRTILQEGDKTYNIRDFPAAANVPLEIARYNNSWYVAVGSDAEQKTYVYKNPDSFLDQNKDQKAVPITVLKATGPVKVLAFSQNARFIMVNNDQHFSVYDAENDKSFRYDIAEPFDQNVKPAWIDGHRILVNSGGQAAIFDYDGINVQKLLTSEPTLPVFFNRDYTSFYNVRPNNTTFNFDQTALRTPKDQ